LGEPLPIASLAEPFIDKTRDPENNNRSSDELHEPD
jgi:hypothetical protein